ncbi:hypothetical protein ACH4UT_33755 [Streptomyces sp. NPDC020799]|uniref:hypothetical protein n=1 Tax=Streptomyces sp. NPDC020799 TaxID=3365091 RepID=UPI0037BC5E40
MTLTIDHAGRLLADPATYANEPLLHQATASYSSSSPTRYATSSAAPPATSDPAPA